MSRWWYKAVSSECFSAREFMATDLFESMRNEDASVLTDAARRNGMSNLREDGWEKIENGVTTVQEVVRVTQEF